MMDYQEPPAIVRMVEPQAPQCGDLLKKLTAGQYSGPYVLFAMSDALSLKDFPPKGLDFRTRQVANIIDVFSEESDIESIRHIYFRHISSRNPWDSVLTYDRITGNPIKLYVRKGGTNRRSGLLEQGDVEYVFAHNSPSILAPTFSLSELKDKIVQVKVICIPEYRKYLDDLVRGKLDGKSK